MKKCCVTLLALLVLAAGLTGQAEGAAPTTATYKVHVLAEDWGCCVDRAILTLDAAIEDASAYTYTVAETHMALDYATFTVGLTTADKTIVSAYLCDENGVAVEGASDHVALELAASPFEGAPIFANNEHFTINEWSDPYYLTITMTGEAGDVEVAQDCTAMLTDTDMFEFSTYTAGNGTAFETALYTPAQASKTLVVWLHGLGEGGTDIRMPLINVDMAALVTDPFQSLMGGAYVLVPQCPTYWMDNDGQGGNFVNGGIQVDINSFYTESLHELIQATREQLGVEHVILAGCSNGGYMTMVLAMNYAGEYDACVPICEAVEDHLISDEQIATLADVPLFFIYAQNDPLVVPSINEEPTIARLREAGAKDLHVFAPEDVHDTTGRFVGEDGQPLQSFGHASWQYFFNNEAVDPDGVNCWAWMAEHAR